MVLIFYAVINLSGLFIFIKMKRNIHILEIMVYWMISSYVFQNFSALCFMNFKTIIIPDILSYEFTHVLNRIVLFPLIMVTFIHYFVAINTVLKKLLLLISYTFLLAGLEWSSNYFGVFVHVHWKSWWSFAFWFFTLLFLMGFTKFFRKILYEGELII